MDILFIFQVADAAMQTDVHKKLYCFYFPKKFPMKARAPFASILKYFSSGAVCEFATKLYFPSSVTDFAELAHIHTTEYEMDLNYQQIPVRLRFSH